MTKKALRTVNADKSPVNETPAAARCAEPQKNRRLTFGDCVDDFFRSQGWQIKKNRTQWVTSLIKLAAPLRSKPVDEIDTAALLAVLTPLWYEAPVTAATLRRRIEAVLEAARVRGDFPRNVDNPARWRGHLDKLLPARLLQPRGQCAGMSYRDIPAFIAQLREREAVAALALEFTILTAVRSAEALGARWDEIDTPAKLWVIPAERMRARREHRVPLSRRAAEILDRLSETRACEYVFPGHRSGRSLSSTAMDMLLRRLEFEGATVLGFRSAFRDWAVDEIGFACADVDAVLAQGVGDKTKQIIQPDNALQRRRELLDAWAQHCECMSASNAAECSHPDGFG
ncbi:MAG: tyrosine-type recombinase/integrase [Methylocystis sp.]|uniref:tyrosine-type recombinase/integrase n=1 Tax=Methylocystis sp. TaxID=1911079 RepID=UPI003DA1E7E0